MLAIVGLLLGLLSLVSGSVKCRCQPGDACWPSEHDWKALNDSIHGHLVRVRPIGHICHEPFYNRTSCNELARLQSDANWRAAQPGALQSFNWENWPQKHESCAIEANPNSTCQQGRIPWYSAVVHSVDEIQEAVRFAKQRNLRLVIKNTGHDSCGRSGAPYSLQILTNRLKNITFHNDFVASRGHSRVNISAITRVPAVTIGAGVMVGELYAAAASRGYIVVAGECTTVGVAGGYLQGGGVSTVLSPMYGLAADHVLELEVVTAQGDLIITNDNQHQDLFWALKGGGGGTYGIVTRATMRAFPDMPSVISTIHFTSTEADDRFWQTVTHVVSLTRSMSVNGNSGQYIVGRLSNFHWFVNWTMFVLNETNSQLVDSQVRPFLSLLGWLGIKYQYHSTVYPKISTFLAIPKQADIGGVGYLQSSKVVSESFMASIRGPSGLVASLSKLALDPGALVTVNVLGGQVNINTSGMHTCVHPNWRSSALLVVLMQSFPPTFQAQAAALEKLIRVNAPVLTSIDPGSTGVYFNEAAPTQDDFQTAFWDRHYERLRRIKNQWDIDGLFMVRNGVGSEDWDVEGMCRKNTTARSSRPNYRANALPS
ncbi:FAD-binding domain-containing protein [Aspergillus ibericus CBS 121593]|uniref:FAD-binding domain-containing protein n=1 Tax=Aspergillus ibericus CBS 121593 TaxID=1448316 RepID=A0A395GKP4_9EURO|nr:FAD-binding domain-containing protein [Aspergillus ibericus CBS 121593]RAK96029.1 FAD-binding domain-containing protein [Aspergillus ibericus CBS 121593]